MCTIKHSFYIAYIEVRQERISWLNGRSKLTRIVLEIFWESTTLEITWESTYTLKYGDTPSMGWFVSVTVKNFQMSSRFFFFLVFVFILIFTVYDISKTSRVNYWPVCISVISHQSWYIFQFIRVLLFVFLSLDKNIEKEIFLFLFFLETYFKIFVHWKEDSRN